MTVEGTYIFGFRGLYCAFEVRCLDVIRGSTQAQQLRLARNELLE